jgi:hypothetical protein
MRLQSRALESEDGPLDDVRTEILLKDGGQFNFLDNATVQSPNI